MEIPSAKEIRDFEETKVALLRRLELNGYRLELVASTIRPPWERIVNDSELSK